MKAEPKVSTRAQVTAAVEKSGIVAIVRMSDASKVEAVVEALLKGGVTSLEVTMSVPGAVEIISELSPKMPKEVMFGAGTVCDVKTAKRVVKAGAAFIVSPIFKEGIVKYCVEQDVASMPGCFTPTEIYAAWEAGADVVKVFPATSLGPDFFRDIKGPLPHIKLMPTGGVQLDNVRDWIRAGAVAVGVGSALMDPAAIASGRYEVLTEKAKAFVDAVGSAR
ncbi:MAG: bifunctional 4-hydroxy-2-oxoglutarate aldolase/2-dehydro-3-deoxy-phosphogluconate aldolase [Polyangiaceae bacterium]|nr:bifunctional 4-hydroxy-2-oxoglutarate aldolase/2-dehydro-3-deoxy-phosphogluconate aldolase [Polyangiaceae bacterium]